MVEKVNPSHPDKIADRIAGAIVDMAYKATEDPRIAVEVLIGHGKAHIIVESSVKISYVDVLMAVRRIAGEGIETVDYLLVPQDKHLAENQRGKLRCGDNGIFKGVPLTNEELMLSDIARGIYKQFPYDGKYILDGRRLIICQSNTKEEFMSEEFEVVSNPLGFWTGGLDVDTGATNRKLGSDMAQSVTGGGLHGKDLSKADVSVNIWAFYRAQQEGHPVELSCAIGDERIDGHPYKRIVDFARGYIEGLGGFEKFAEWGLF